MAVCLTHPIQYFSPWFRYIASQRREVDLTVLYAVQPAPEQQGTGFDRPFSWDVSLTEGYEHRFLNDRRNASVSSDTFFGVDAPGVEAALRASSPDVVLVPGWHSVSQIRALRACRRLGIPALYRGDSNLLTAPRGPRKALWRLRTRAVLTHGYQAWLAVGVRSREYLESFGVPAPLVFDSPHAVDNDFFARGADRYRTGAARASARASIGLAPSDVALLFAGKLVDRKRPLDVIRAAHLIGPEAVVVVAGDGALREQCASEAARLGVRLIWLGFINQSGMARVYATSDCVVLPSDTRETWGLVVNEALASGTPCVVSDHVGAGPDLVRPGSLAGEVYETGDPSALANAVRALRRRTACRDRSAAACREAVGRHTFGRATDGLVEAAQRLAAMRRVSIRANPGTPRVLALCGGMVIVSGIERMSFEVLQVLREGGAAVHCIVNRWGSGAIVDRADAIGASWSTGFYRHAFTRHLDMRRWIQGSWDVLMTSAGLLRDAWRFRPTHVLLPEFTTGIRNAPALWLLRALGVIVIMRIGNAPEPGRVYRVIWRRILDPGVTRFVSNSDFTARELLAHGVDPAKARTIKNTVPTRQGRAGETGPRVPGRIIYIGQVIPPKGLDLLLEAVARLRAGGYQATLDVVGDIDGWEAPAYDGFRAAIRARAARPDIAQHVRFLGLREDVPALLAAASLHACPSRPEQKEAFGIVNIEAKRAGIPSVVFPTGALPEIVTHRDDGWVCREVSVEALLEGLEYFLSDPDRLRRAGERARASDRVYSRERFAAAWSEEFGMMQNAMATEQAAL